MSASLPTELIDSALSHLSGTPSINDCALVCHSWLPSARYHLLPPPKILHLDQFQIADFLRLIDSPKSTLSLISFSALHLRQNTVIDFDNHIPPDTEAWRSCRAVSDLFSRNLSFPSITTSLFLEWIDWKSMSWPALISLQSRYTTVKELELRCITCALPEFFSLIAGLTALEKITINAGVPSTEDPWVVDSVQIAHPSLRALVFNDPPRPWVIQFFARAILYTAGLNIISIRLPYAGQGFQACGELLETAGTSLRELKLRGLYGYPLTSETRDPFAELVALPRNPNLQEIEINMVDSEAAIKLLVQGLKLNSKPHLRQLKLGLEDRDGLKKWAGSQLLVDEALSTMMLKNPKLIIGIPPLKIQHLRRFQDLSLYELEQSYFEKLLELKSLLPRTAECWEFKVVDTYF